MKRLLLVSNRLPITIEKRKGEFNYHQSVGGLATGLASFYKNYDSLWIGWCGLTSNSMDSNIKKEIETTLLNKYKSIPTFLSRNDLKMFYSNFCNRTLWPLFHYFLDYAVYDKDSWESFKHVNKLFSQAVLEVAKPNDIIWIHDYHLMLLPKLLREKLPNAQIGFFLHIPFPSYEVFRLLPWRNEILEGLFGADLIGFHTYDYVRHFMSSARRLLGYEHAFGQLTVDHRVVKVDAFPMGINYKKYANAKIKPEWLKEVTSHCDLGGECKIILSVDRLDYTKGIPQRLEAFDHFLTKYPEHKKKVTLIMIAVPSRTSVLTYRLLKQQVDELVGRINGKHGTMGWMPVWYHYRFIPFENITALYNLADVALVTPLRDGMNLIAKEYVAAKKDNKGVLILSEMAGAMSELAEAIIVNPNSKDEVADAIEEALNLSDDEKIENNEIMKNRLMRYNVVAWAKDFINSLDKIKDQQREIGTKRLTRLKMRAMLKYYKKSENRLIFLDYDGTLVPFAKKPEKAKPDDELLHLLQKLIKDRKNEVILVSGRDRRCLDNWFGHLNIGLTAEHGIWIKTNRKTWQLIEPMQNDWMGKIRPILEFYVDRTPGSFIEKKSYSLVWHYRRTSDELGLVRARELMEDLLHLTSNLNLMVLEGSKVIEIKTGGINKGKAASKWLSKAEWDFLLAIGDDWTDEDLFDAMPDEAYTIKVGTAMSKAKYSLTDHIDVRELLKELTKAS